MTPEARAQQIKVILFDVDGVLTDGQIIIVPESSAPDAKGIEVKGFSAHDGLGISLARLAGLQIGFITKRQSRTVAIRARDLKLEFVYQGQSHKMNAVNDILARTGLDLSHLAYVGDDIIDLPVMRLVGFAVATANARPEAKAAAHYITPNPGGQGAGRDVIDFILTARGILAQTIEQYLDPTNAEAKSADIGSGNM